MKLKPNESGLIIPATVDTGGNVPDCANDAPLTRDELDDDHPLWCVNEQIKGLLEGIGADDDHNAVLGFLRATGLPEGTVERVHRAIVWGENETRKEELTRIALFHDHALVARALSTVPFCRWEPFEGKASSRGELLLNGTRYSTTLDEFGVPALYPHLRDTLIAYFHKQDQTGPMTND